MAKSRLSEISSLMERAEKALHERAWFEAEAIALDALQQARAAERFDEMARILLPLQEARRQRADAALDAGEIRIVSEPVPEEAAVEPGLYLFEPPLVGADARRWRLLALAQSVPVLVLCREPITKSNTCPIVAIGPQSTLRVRIDPPKSLSRPNKAWFTAALEQLGDAAIAGLDPGVDLVRRIDQLLSCLGAHPDHEKLHQALAELCREAGRSGAKAPATKSSRAKVAVPEPDDEA
jgi:hypothetical protein